MLNIEKAKKYVTTTILTVLDYCLYVITGQNKFGEIISYFYQSTSDNTPVSKKLLRDIYNIALADQKMYEAPFSVVLTNLYEHMTGVHPEQLYDLVLSTGDIEALEMLVDRGVYDNAVLFNNLLRAGQEKAALHLFNYKDIYLDQNSWDKILSFASVNDYTTIAQIAIQKGANVNSHSYTRSPLQLAVSDNYYSMVKLLKESGAEVSDNILFFAISDKHLNSGVVPYLVEECQVDLSYLENGFTVLMLSISISWRHTKLAHYFVDHNADTNINKADWIPLYDAFAIGEIELAFSLMRHGANLKDPHINLLSKALSTSTKTEKDMTNVISFMLCEGEYTASEVKEIQDVEMSYQAEIILSSVIDSPIDFCDNFLINEQNFAS